MSKMIDDKVERRLRHRLNKDEPRQEVRKRLNFQDEDDDKEDSERTRKESYDKRVDMLIQQDEKKKADHEEKEQRKMEAMFK